MNTLPPEIFCYIISHFSFSEKLRLLYVCRRWYNLIRTTNLYACLSIKGPNKFAAAIKAFEEKPQLRYQVRNLQITRTRAKHQEVLAIPTLFPRLTHLAYHEYSRHNDDSELSELCLEHWERLESYVETNTNPIMLPLLTNIRFTQMKQMKIDFTMNYNNCYNLFCLMKHTPNLECLELSFAAVNLEMMEILHNNVVGLKILVLKDAVHEPSDFDAIYESNQQGAIQTNQGNDQEQIDRHHHTYTQPAREIQDFRIYNLKSRDDDNLPIEWMTYIAFKYSEAKCLTIRKRMSHRVYVDYYQYKLNLILSNLLKLESYDVDVQYLTPGIAASLDNNGVALQKILLSDEVTLQLGCLIDSRQRFSLSHMAIKSNELMSGIVDYMVRFDNLKVLTLENTCKTKQRAFVPLDTILDKLNYLEDLVLFGCDIQLSPKFLEKRSSVFRLKKLALERAMLMNTSSTNRHLDITEFISQTCPHLTKITIQGSVMDSNYQSVRLNFSEHKIRVIKVNIIDNKVYKIDNGTLTKWYSYQDQRLKEISNEALDEPMHDTYVSIVHRGFCQIILQGIHL